MPRTSGNVAADVTDAAHNPAADVDVARIRAAVTELLFAIGEDPSRSGLIDTPRRVAEAYGEFFLRSGSRPADPPRASHRRRLRRRPGDSAKHRVPRDLRTSPAAVPGRRPHRLRARE